MEYLIGVDIGTTNIKAIALTAAGHLLAQANRPTQTLSPFPGAAEQAPDAIYSKVLQVIRAVVRASKGSGNPAGLVFSGAMHSLIALDAAGKPLTNAWLWSDLRATDFANTLRHADKDRELYRRTGTPIHPMSPLVKLQWLRRRRPEIFALSHTFLGIKDFVFQKIVQENVCDASLASASGLLNTVSGRWDDLALQTAGITAAHLPRVVSPAQIFTLPSKTALLLGLPAGTPVIAGASDGALANLGSGATNPKTLAITIGTSAALRLTLEQPFFDPHGRTFCYRLDDRRFIAGGASNNGSNVLDWLRQQIFHARLTPARFLAQAGQISPGSEGLVFVPYLYGERAPVWDAEAVGIFHGLKAHHTRDHLLRAAVEGVALNLRVIAGFLPQVSDVQNIALSGGVTKSPLWPQTVADIFQKPVQVAEDGTVDASARGAVVLAREALGLPALPPLAVGSVLPDPDHAGVYNDAFLRFQQAL